MTNLPIPVIVGNENEMLSFLSKHDKQFDKKESAERIKNCDAMVVDVQYKGYDTWVVYFRCDDVRKGVKFKDLAHETFHLWGSLNAFMYGSEYVQYHLDQDEQCAYHFARLFDDMAKVIAEADERFQKGAKESNKAINYPSSYQVSETTEQYGTAQTESIETMVAKINEQNKIESEEIPFIAIDGTDKTAEEIIADLRKKNT